MATQNKNSFAELLLLAAMWGPSFLFIKVAVAEVPPLTAVWIRVAMASLIFLIILQCRGRKLPTSLKSWRHATAMGFLSCIFPFSLFCYAEIHIHSSLAGIINGSVPIITALLVNWVLPSERLTFSKVVGVSVGFAGLLVLLLPTLLDGHISYDTVGMLFCVLASVFYALGMVYARLNMQSLPPLIGPSMQVIAATVFLLPAALIVDEPWNLTFPSLKALGSIAGLAVFSTVGAFLLYFRIVAMSGATVLATVTYFLPILGTIFGVVFLNEPLTFNLIIATTLIVSGMMLVNGTLSLPAAKKLQKI